MPNADYTTRDIAMNAQTLISHHMTDCEQFRVNLRQDMSEFRDDLKKLNWRMAMILGGLVILSHGIDWILSATGHR